MARVVVQPSVRLAELVRERRRALGLSLRDVERISERASAVIPSSTLSKIEQGRVDPGVRRLTRLLRLYDLPFRQVADLLDLERLESAPPEDSLDPDELLNQGRELWVRGDTQGAMTHLSFARAHSSAPRVTRQRATLLLGVIATALGRNERSGELIDKLLFEPPEPELLVEVLLQSVRVWHHRGVVDVAEAFLEQARARIDGEPRQSARFLAQRGSLRITVGKYREAEEDHEAAIESLTREGLTHFASVTLCSRVRLERERGDLTAVIQQADRGLQMARKHGFRRHVVSHRLDAATARFRVSDPHSADRDDALRTIESCRDELATIEDPGLHLRFQYARWWIARAADDETLIRQALVASSKIWPHTTLDSIEARELRAAYDSRN